MNFPVASIIPMQFQECKMCQTILFMLLPRNDPRIRYGSTQSKCIFAARRRPTWGNGGLMRPFRELGVRVSRERGNLERGNNTLLLLRASLQDFDRAAANERVC